MGEQEALFEEPDPVPPGGDGDWVVSPPPGWRYQLLGEDNEFLMIEGHGIGEDGIHEVLLHAGQWWGFDEPVPVLRTWARTVTRCPRHGWLPLPLRAAVTVPVEWVRWQVSRVLWKLWGSKDPLRQWWRPKWLAWVQRSWIRFAYCSYCEWERDLRCADRSPGEYREELVGSYWTWGTDGKPADVNCGRRGYIPVTIVELEV